MGGLVLLMPLSQRPYGAVPLHPGILFLSLTVAIPHAGSFCAALLLLPPGP